MSWAIPEIGFGFETGLVVLDWGSEKLGIKNDSKSGSGSDSVGVRAMWRGV